MTGLFTSSISEQTYYVGDYYSILDSRFFIKLKNRINISINYNLDQSPVSIVEVW